MAFIELTITKDKNLYLPIADIKTICTEISETVLGSKKFFQSTITCTLKTGDSHVEIQVFLSRENAEEYLNSFIKQILYGNKPTENTNRP